MNPKLLLGLALVLSGQCFAAIIYPQAPDGGREMVVKYLDSRFLKFLKVSRIEDLTIAKPFGDYYVTSLTNLSPGNFLSRAKRGLWVYPIMQGTNVIGEMGLVTDQQSEKGLKYNYFKNIFPTNAALEGLRIAEQLPQIKNQDYELRRLDIFPIHFHSIWLHGKSDDILIPLPLTFGRWNACQPYSESQMIALLKPEVEKARKTWKPFIPK